MSGESKYGMHIVMLNLEADMLDLSKVASTVVGHLKTRVKWGAEVEINRMAKVFAVPKSEDGKTVKQQEDELSEQCAALIATKLLVLTEEPGFK